MNVTLTRKRNLSTAAPGQRASERVCNRAVTCGEETLLTKTRPRSLSSKCQQRSTILVICKLGQNSGGSFFMAGIIGAHMLATNPASLICELPVWAAAGWYGCRAVGSSSWKVHQNTSDLLRGPLWVKMSFHQVITKPLRRRESEP